MSGEQFMLRPLTASELKVLLGDNFINTFQTEMNKIIEPLRKYISRGYPLSMGKELWEYVVADSIEGATWNGAGSSVADVLKPISADQAIAFDVKTVGCSEKSKISGEASMLQSYNQDNKIHFKDGNGQALWDNYIGGWQEKIKGFEKYYLLGIIRSKETLDCSLIAFEATGTSPMFTEGNFEFISKSGKIKGVVDPEFAKIRYVNAKSRIEIQFLKRAWTDSAYCLNIFKG